MTLTGFTVSTATVAVVIAAVVSGVEAAASGACSKGPWSTVLPLVAANTASSLSAHEAWVPPSDLFEASCGS